LAGIKLSVNDTYGDKTLSVIQTNHIIKAVKGKKLTKMMKRITNVVLPLPPMFRKPGSKTVNAAHLAKSLATFQLIFKPKKDSDCCPRTTFCNRTMNQSHCRLSLGLLMVTKASRQSANLPIF
jgi:hypothetical protein